MNNLKTTPFGRLIISVNITYEENIRLVKTEKEDQLQKIEKNILSLIPREELKDFLLTKIKCYENRTLIELLLSSGIIDKEGDFKPEPVAVPYTSFFRKVLIDGDSEFIFSYIEEKINLINRLLNGKGKLYIIRSCDSRFVLISLMEIEEVTKR